MTPSNPDNHHPLIYRIADALGVFHLVAPVNHTHSQAEVDGLADALAAKADANHSHTAIGDENTYISASEGVITISVDNGEAGGEADITPSRMANLERALSDPDTAPTANSTKLVTSGGVAAALTRSVSVMTSNIDVEGLPNGKIIPVSYLNTSNEAKNLYDIFSFDNVTTQVKRLAINTEDVEIPSSGRAFAFIMKKTSESALDSMTTLHVWYQGAGRIVIR